MEKDITELLREWEYDPEKSIRIVTAQDGRDVLQVRLPLGIEQYELDGRPDGKVFMGKETLLEKYREEIDARVRAGETGFTFSHDDFIILQNESTLFYYRYLLLFQIGDFSRVVRDTEHNLAICDLIERYCADPDNRKALLQYKPYMLRMNAVSRAMISLHRHAKTVAQEILEKAINEIKSMSEIDSPAFQFERIRSINYLKSALKQVHEKPVNPLEDLKRELQEAIRVENYEHAAELRDRIKALEDGSGPDRQ